MIESYVKTFIEYTKLDIKTIENALKNLNKNHIIIENSLSKIDEENRKKNPFITKRIIKYLATGLSEHDSILATAKDYDEPISRVEIVWTQHSRHKTALKLYAKRYLCEKLKNKGFTGKQIADILGVSENHIYKLLKNKINF